MATVLDRVPLDHIQAEARSIQFARVFLTLLAVPFIAVGWLAGKAWAGVAFAVAAVKVGWQLGVQAAAPPADGGG